MGRTANFQGFEAALPTQLGTSIFHYIGFQSTALILDKTNSRLSMCVKCGEAIEAGQGIYKQEYGRRGFLHLQCAKQLIFKYGGELGFTENALFNLQACKHSHGRFTAKQVADSIRPYLGIEFADGVAVVTEPPAIEAEAAA